MRIVLDMQAVQTESRFRGIGRYALSLAGAIAKNRGSHELFLVLNGLFPDTIESVRTHFENLLPQQNICTWYSPGPVRENNLENRMRREIAERVREAYLAQLKPDVVHVFSLLEGFVDDAVTSIGVFAPQIPTTVTLYDLIPFLNREVYLEPNPLYEEHYLRKIEHLKKAKSWFAISEWTAKEAAQTFGVDCPPVVNVGAACDSMFVPQKVSSLGKQKLYSRFHISRPFVLYSGATDHRKNLPRLLRAYAQLTTRLRDSYQLVLIGKHPAGDVQVLKQVAAKAGLSEDELILTGYISDQDLVQLYNLCTVFVLPSWHEGFGLPVLEAMSCGRAVVAANTSSLPEVIGRQDALFDPLNEDSIAQKLTEVLSDEIFRKDLEHHGLKQAEKFSWQQSAECAIKMFEEVYFKLQIPKKDLINRAPDNLKFPRSPEILIRSRPRMAYISPLPPAKTGIADYSSELLPALSRHYEIDAITDGNTVSDSWVRANCRVQNPDWFRKHAKRYDRVLYHFGNSPFHGYAFDLIQNIPGVVVLHDFYLPHLIVSRGNHSDLFTEELWYAHGYQAVCDRFRGSELRVMTEYYPCNLTIVQAARGIIVHSGHSRDLARHWYGPDAATAWSIVPHVRKLPELVDWRASARSTFGLKDTDFVVCSFGILDPTKLNHRLLDCWIKSSLGKDRNCLLFFVGEKPDNDYGKRLVERMQNSESSTRVHITGWVNQITYRQYLAIADMGVQLRSLSRGESSGTVLDCMAYGMSTIANAHGSLADLPDEAVWKMRDEFTDEELVTALETLRHNELLRRKLSGRARTIIQLKHAPSACALQYKEVIEGFHQNPDVWSLTRSIAEVVNEAPSRFDIMDLVSSVSQTLIQKPRLKKIFIDVTATAENDAKTGIERVARAYCHELILNPPDGFRVEPICLSNHQGRWYYNYAKQFALKLLECPQDALEDAPIEYQAGDIFIGLDINDKLSKAAEQGLLDNLKNSGVRIYFLIHDLLPLLRPDFFPPGHERSFLQWFNPVVDYADGVVTTSRTVADTLRMLAPVIETSRTTGRLNVAWNYSGADINSSVPTKGMPTTAHRVLKRLRTHLSFLMVGTIEPRKGHQQVICAFEKLWVEKVDVNLVIVGKTGWNNILPVIEKIRTHPALGKRLFWLEAVSDEYLEKIYSACACLIAASEAEGFGLPLIEAARHGLPIIARDIPVFREVCGQHIFYFSGESDQALADTILDWLELREKGKVIESAGLPWLTWKESAERLVRNILQDEWPIRLALDGCCYPGGLQTHRSRRLKWRGFSDPEEEIRWTDGHQASIVFNWPENHAAEARLSIVLDTLGLQRFSITHAGVEIYSGSLDGHHEVSCLLTELFPGTHVLNFSIPDAHQPGNGDDRQLALAIRSLAISTP